MNITNNLGINLALSVWLLHDEYDYISDPNYISATRLMKPIRQLVLAARVPPEQRTLDVADLIPSAIGHSLHDSIEKAWKVGYRRSLRLLGYPDKIIDRVAINPTNEEVENNSDIIPIYLEQRAKKSINGFTIGGKFDLVAEGIVHDNKSTSAYTWLYGGRDKEHQLQGSIYRWLNQDKIAEEFIRICYIFTDWQKATAKQNPNYPQNRLATKDILLLSVEDTEKWIVAKLNQFITYKDADQDAIPECTDDELWRSEPVFKYYSDPTKTTGRSTKNFEDLASANSFKAEKGGKGIVITVIGEPKRCGYCDVYSICKQKDRYFE